MNLILTLDSNAVYAILVVFLLLKTLPYLCKKLSQFITYIKTKRAEKYYDKLWKESNNQEDEEVIQNPSELVPSLTEDELAILERSKLISKELHDIEEIEKYERMFYSSKEDDSVEYIPQEEISKFQKDVEITK